VFGTGSGPLYGVSESGGTPKPVTSLDRSRGDSSHRAPQFLPDGRLLYLVQSAERPGIYVGAMEPASAPQLVMTSTSPVRYAPPGYLFFGRQGTLMAQRFDAGSLRMMGEPFPIAEQVGQGQLGIRFSASDTGVLAYASWGWSTNVQVRWYSREGKRLASVGESGLYRQIALSPDEKRVAIERVDPKVSSNDIWLLELTTGVLEPLTLSSLNEGDPVWSPDGRRVVFGSNRNGRAALYWKVVGGGDEELLFQPAESLFAEQFYGGGRFLLCLSNNGRTFQSVPLTGERKPTILYPTDFVKDEPHVSPDERWVAYGSSQSGRWEIYTAKFPSFDERRQLSKSGGVQPRWRKDGRELYYISPDGKVMAADVKSGASLEIGAPRELFQIPFRPEPILHQYAVSGDGRRFLIAEPIGESNREITVVLNWTPDFERKQH
jgi:hypothetical protein